MKRLDNRDNRDKLLAELVHYLASGTQYTMGLSLRETLQFLSKPIASKDNKTAIECIDIDGRKFINELRTYMNELDE